MKVRDLREKLKDLENEADVDLYVDCEEGVVHICGARSVRVDPGDGTVLISDQLTS